MIAPGRAGQRSRAAAPAWTFLAVLCVGVALPSRARCADLQELHQGDLVQILLSRGGEVTGHVVAVVGEYLHVALEERTARVHTALIAQVTLLERTSSAALPWVEAEPDETTPEGRRALRRARTHANGLAVASFFLPGLGQFANGQPGLGSTYLAGILVLDAAIVLSAVLNEDPVVPVVLGALDLAARVTSAIHARSNAPGLVVTVHPCRGGEGGERGVAVGVTMRWAIGPPP